MEILTKRSKIVAAEDTAAIDIPETVLTFSGSYNRIVHTTSPPTDDTRLFTFEVLPSVSGQLQLNECQIVTKWKLVKKDGSPIAATTQVGVCQALGVTAFDACQIKIAGAPYRPEFNECSDHFNHMRLLFGHTDREKISILKPIG